MPHRYACGASTKSGKPETACALPAAPRTRTRTLGSVIRHAPPETMAVPLSPLPRRGSDPAAQRALANRPHPRHLAPAPANHRPQDAPHVAREYGIGKSPRCCRKVRHSVCVRPSCFGANDVLLRAFAAARRNLANVRVVQRNLVYVVGLAPDIAREDVRRSWLLVVGRLMLTTLGSPLRPCGRTFTLGSTEQS